MSVLLGCSCGPQLVRASSSGGSLGPADRDTVAPMLASQGGDAFSAAVPMDRLQAMVREEELPDRMAGSALLADISGFTPLTEALTRHYGGRRGAEELAVHLNTLYGALIEQVDHFGGSVIGFSGDAITCWFGAEGGNATPSIEDPAHRAAAAAGAMMTRLGELPTIEVDDGSSVSFGVRIGVASGAVRRFVVGDPTIQRLDVLAGATVSRMAAAEHAAGVGEIVVDRETAHAIGPFRDERRSAEQETGPFTVLSAVPAVASRPWPRIEPGAIARETLRQWLLPLVWRRLALGHGEVLTELRQTIALFLRFDGLEYDVDDVAGDRLDSYIRWVQEVLARYEASLLDITVGDKGSYLYACFGAPIAHEDEYRRAASAALELRDTPKRLDFVRRTHIGISRGVMRAGTVGNATRRTYAVLGDEVNLAARLMQLAGDGQIIVSGRVREASGEHFAFEALPAIAVKGKAAPVSAYQLTGPGSGRAPGRHVAFVGRGRERDVIAGSLQRLLAGERSIIVLEGEPGLGKSRLVQDLRERADESGVVVHTGYGDAVGRSTLFLAWRPIFRGILGLDDERVPASHVEHVLDAIADLTGNREDRARAPLLSAVVSVAIADNDVTMPLTGQLRAEARLDLLVRLLEGLARRTPIAIVLEDAHWLDTASWTLLQRVARRQDPILFAVVSRPFDEGRPAELEELTADPATHHIELGPLVPDEIGAIVRQRLGVTSLPESVAELIVHRAEGNPFFAEEIALGLRDSGVVSVSGSECRLIASPQELERLDVPDTVEGVITGRIDGLSPTQKFTIMVASVIGRTFPYRALEEILPVREQVLRLHDDLDVLSLRDLTPLLTVDPELTYIFKHVITQEVAYNTMPFRQRGQLHRAVGEWYERTYAENLAPHFAVLAQHWQRTLEVTPEADDAVDRAIRYAEKAGEQALRNNAHVEAAGHFRHVIDVVRGRESERKLARHELSAQTMLGYALMNQRGYGDPDVESAYRRAWELTGHTGVARSAELGPILYGILSYYASRGEYDSAAEVAGEIVQLGTQLENPQVLLIGHNAMGLTAILRGDPASGRDHTEKSYALADVHQDQAFMLRYGGDFRGYPRAWLSTAECLLGFPDRALSTFERALEVTQEHPYTYGFMLTFGVVPILRMDLDETAIRAQELSDIAGRYGFPLLMLVANIHRGWALAQRERSAEGVELIAGSIPVIRMIKLDSFLPMYLGLLADAQLATHGVDDALATLGDAKGFVDTSGGSFFEAELERLTGEALLAKGASTDAEARFRAAAEIARAQGARWFELRATLSFHRAASGTDREEAAGRLAQLLTGFTEGFETVDLRAARAALERVNR